MHIGFLFIVFALYSYADAEIVVSDPYADVEWGKIEYLHSFTHQHVYGDSLQQLHDMGFRHLPVSNYYPSKPLYPLPEAFLRKNPGALGAPNAEQHSTTDSSIHFNAVGSYYTTGYGETPAVDKKSSPVDHVFCGLKVFNPSESPWEGLYRLDLDFEAADGSGAPVSLALTVDGARDAAVRSSAPSEDEAGVISGKTLKTGGPRSTRLKAIADKIRVRIEFDPATTRLTRFRLMQGCYRPWRDAFRAALDGTLKDADGNRVEGLMFADGGGITINHPEEALARVIEQLDFDKRVLGIEVWNQHIFFGGSTIEKAEEMPFYSLWDQILKNKRRCFGFFVKDHCVYGRGRNILLVPDSDGSPMRDREHAALRAYRGGRFFGLLGAVAVDADGRSRQPYDYSDFRFTRIAVRRKSGKPYGLEVSVDGSDMELRPNTQIRFITDSGVAEVANGKDAFFTFPADARGNPECGYVRVEAFAYPDTHMGGQPLTAAGFTGMNVFQIARLHNHKGACGTVYMDAPGKTPLGIADMIFSQPIMFAR